MPAYQIQFNHSAMRPEYVGSATKFAHTEDDALKCLAGKAGKYDKKANLVIDKNNNRLNILEIKKI